MTKEEIIEATKQHVKQVLSGEGSGHDWWHIQRVWNNAKLIAEGEKADLFIVELGALLHDIADYKFHNGDEEIGGKTAGEWLEKCNCDPEVIEKVVHIVNHVSFKGNVHENKMKSIEGKIVQDADRLDAMGAMGIARCFTYGGSKGREIYNPDKKFKPNMTKDEYKSNDGSAINHFYEKLLLLKDLMNTETAKKIATERHIFMEQYLERFFQEWNGEK